MSVTKRPEPAETGAGAGRPRRVAGRRLVKIAVLSITVLLTAGISGAYLTSERLAGQVHRYAGAFAGLDEKTRPADTPATTVLLVVSDSLSPARPAGVGDTGTGDLPAAIMLIDIAADYTGATAVSVPSDSWASLPGQGTDRMSASYAAGGPPRLVRAVEALTGIRVDHFAVIDFAGFQALTDSVGGIDVDIVGRATGQGPDGPVTFHSGLNHLGGTQVLAYLRGNPGGGDGQVKRQQSALRALLVKAGSGDLLTSPIRGFEFLDTLTRWIGVDDTVTNGDLRAMVWRLRGLDPRRVTFLTAPLLAPGAQTAKPPMRLDTVRGTELWQAVGDGDLGRYLRKYPADSLGGVTP